KGQCLSA
ncbi:hypothetical protein D030_4015B, partial [Vibrio parahaemolyticus AQ3810]